MKSDCTPRSDRPARRAVPLFAGREFRICFRGIPDPEYRVRNRVRRSQHRLPVFVEDHEHRARSATMGIRKSAVLVSLVLVLIAVEAGLLAGIRPTLGAAQESAKSPRASLLVAANPPRLLFSTAETRVNNPGFFKTQAALIRSRLVLSAAVRNPGIARLPSIKGRPDLVAWLEQFLEVTNPKDTEILQVSLAPGSGLSAEDQATFINAIVRSYVDEVVRVDQKRYIERRDQLRKIKESYAELLKKKRETLRKLSESPGQAGSLTAPERDAWSRLYQDLRGQRVKLRLERAEAETLLERRKKSEGAQADATRKEIAAIEEGLAVLNARQRVLDEELERLAHEMHAAAVQELDLKALKDEIELIDDAARKVAAEFEALNVELEAPPRIRIMDLAAPHG
jgi:hypothetical protein